MQSQVLFKYRETGGNNKWLDNLKLGYGGTQSEMQRLLSDAQKLTGVKYDINSLADVYSAIHAIQEEMGITGTTAAEAEQTISGSLASMKASWQNLLVGIAAGGNLDGLINNFVKSSKTFIGNIQKVMPTIIQGVNGLIQGLIPEIPGILESILPGLLEGAASLFGGLVSALPDLIDIVIQALPGVMDTLLTAFEPILGKTLTSVLRGVGNTVVNVIGAVHKIITGEVETVDASLSTATGRWVAGMEEALAACENLLDEERRRKELADGYLDTLETLESKEIKTDEDLWAMQEATAALCNLYPELKSHVNEETGLFNENTEAIRANVTELNNLALAHARQNLTEDLQEGINQNTELKLESEAEEAESIKKAEEFLQKADAANKAIAELEAAGTNGKLSVASSDLIKAEGMESLFQWDLDGRAYVDNIVAYRDAMNDLQMVYGEATEEAAWWTNSAEREQGKQARLNNEMLRIGEEYLSMIETISKEEGGFTKDSAATFAAYAESISQYGELSQSAKEAWAEALIVMGTPPDEAEAIAGLNKVEEEAQKATEGVEKAEEAAGAAKEAANSAGEAAAATAEAAEQMFSATPSTDGVTSAAATVNSALDGVIAKAREASEALANVFGGRGGGSKNGGNGSGAEWANADLRFPGHKTGLDFVPRDNYLARLHQGEAVLTAEEARAWRNGQHGRQEVYHGESIITGNNFYIQQESDIYDLAVELSSLRREFRRGKGARG